MTSTPTPVNATPIPPVPLKDHCSVIFNSNGVDVLYTYQSNAFQSLPLQSGAKWASLPMGVAVNGAKCVLGQWDHQDALILVGGTTADPAQKDYPGLQYFTFSTRAWASIPNGQTVTQNRQMHGAAFLNSTNSLLVFSGFQDNSNKQSSETFTIVAEPPYKVDSHPAAAPLGMNPIVMPWNESHAVMVGGSKDNRAVWLFSQESKWKQIGVNIPPEIPDMSNVQATTMDGINDAKLLQVFNLRAAPNRISSVFIQAADSIPATGNVKRQIDVGKLPPYDASTASIVERNGYSLAQSRSSPMVVASGGTGDAQSPLIMFNQTSNGWLKAGDFFSGQSKAASNNIQSALTESATATATNSISSATTSSDPTSVGAAQPSSTVATGGDGLSDSGRTILGAVLGGLAGAGALLILLLLCLRWRKQKRRARQLYHQENKNQMGFDDSDAVAGFKRSASKASKHSGKDEWQRMPTAQEKLGATISRPNLVYDSLSPTGIGSREITQPLISSTLPPTEVKSDDGWNQYFSKNGSSNALMPDGNDRMRMDSVSRTTEYTLSNYDIESHTASVYHDNDTDPLNPRSSGYPQSEQSWEQSKLHPKHARGPSSNYRPGSTISEEEPENFLHPGSSTTGTQAWESLGPNDGQGNFSRRPTSSMYADSINYPHPGDKVNITGDEDSLNTTGAVKSNTTNNSWRTQNDSRGMRTLATKDLTGSKPQKDDMSWLNLGKQ